MKCHVLSCGPPKMSCFVMVCCASGPVAAHPYPACGSSIAFRSTPFPPPRRTRRTLHMAALTPRRTRRALQMAALTPPARPPGGTLFRAYRAPAPARRRALAPARFARLIAPARGRPRNQGARLPSVSRGSFRAGANRDGKRLPGGRFLPPALYGRGSSRVNQI